MIYVILAFAVAAIYFVVYRFSKLFGMTNSTTVLVDTTYESIKKGRFKIPIWQLTTSGIRNVLYGWAIIFVLGCTVMIALVAVTILNG
ncbi:hypothetical protein [Mesorhizobium sp. IMUNJ 23232]|uniref:hypothetical protein n=1 Tax=Mesorhizobium sp. IMUNJ 23232 TaxID=3376064 RepID=UPI0037A11A7A